MAYRSNTPIGSHTPIETIRYSVSLHTPNTEDTLIILPVNFCSLQLQQKIDLQPFKEMEISGP